MVSTHSPTSEAGGKVVAQPPKGGPHFHRPSGRLPGFIIRDVLYYFKDAHQGLRPPPRKRPQPLARALAQGHTPLCVQRPQVPLGIQTLHGCTPTFPFESSEPSRQRRVPHAPLNIFSTSSHFIMPSSFSPIPSKWRGKKVSLLCMPGTWRCRICSAV